MSATRAMEECLSRIGELDGAIRAFVDMDEHSAMSAARIADEAPRDLRGPLHGLPVAIKEVFDVKDMRCGWGSPIHRDRVPREDAEAVRRLRDAGAIVVGTVVSTEYAIAAAGPTVNPHDCSRTPGGSSSGPAAAVASAMVPVALGSQTVGSIVRPAAYCGVFGLKPTRGAIPGRGGMPLSPRLDHPGIFARAAEDLPLLCNVLFGRDPQDETSRDVAPPAKLPDLRDLRILVSRRVPPDPASGESEHAVDRAVERLKGLGARMEPFDFGSRFGAVFDVLHTVMTRDMALAHGDDRDRHGDGMSPRLRGLIDHGRAVSESEYDRAVATAESWTSEFEE
jgi:Asp-tRNA(Asn)/Glu-tRNA(Gln) amidotransferase A subunit family amidase